MGLYAIPRFGITELNCDETRRDEDSLLITLFKCMQPNHVYLQ